jgi:hypothetical protein
MEWPRRPEQNTGEPEKLSHLSHFDSFATGAFLEDDASGSHQTRRKNIKKGVFHGAETVFAPKRQYVEARSTLGRFKNIK